MLRCRGVRGATTVDANNADAILSATRELLALITDANQIEVEDITSAFFTLTDDLDAVYPALAARQMGWDDVALLCAREILVPDSQSRCVRVLLHINTTKRPDEIRHVYLRDAVHLRPSRALTNVSATRAPNGTEGGVA